jgi:glucosylceramidase
MSVSKMLLLPVTLLINSVCYAQSTVNWWLTTNDKSALLTKQAPLVFTTASSNDVPVITIDPSKKYQSIDGFGFALTGGSAQT